MTIYLKEPVLAGATIAATIDGAVIVLKTGNNYSLMPFLFKNSLQEGFVHGYEINPDKTFRKLPRKLDRDKVRWIYSPDGTPLLRLDDQPPQAWETMLHFPVQDDLRLTYVNVFHDGDWYRTFVQPDGILYNTSGKCFVEFLSDREDSQRLHRILPKDFLKRVDRVAAWVYDQGTATLVRRESAVLVSVQGKLEA